MEEGLFRHHGHLGAGDLLPREEFKATMAAVHEMIDGLIDKLKHMQGMLQRIAAGGLHASVDSPTMRRCLQNRKNNLWTYSIKHLVQLRTNTNRYFLKRLLFPLHAGSYGGLLLDISDFTSDGNQIYSNLKSQYLIELQEKRN